MFFPREVTAQTKTLFMAAAWFQNILNRTECSSRDVLMLLGVAWNKSKLLRVQKYGMK